jgi:nitrate/nitrite-specific signal transduction histidine kinase
MITNDSFIALFDGQPQSYQEWRKRINIYHLKMKLQKRSAESILNIIGSLQGTAWRLVENCNLAKIDGDSAFDDLMKTLDKAFQYDARVRLPQDFDGYFSHLSRKPGETLLSFITNHDEKLRKIEEHGIKIPDEVPGWL